jgi:ABC-2 type transport system ATP-binding protein
MTVNEVIRFTRPFFPKWRGDLEQRYLKMFDLPPNRKIPDLSKGMRSKLMLLLALSRGSRPGGGSYTCSPYLVLWWLSAI